MTIDCQCISNSVFRKQKASVEALFIILFKIKRACEYIILKKSRSFRSPQLNGVFLERVYYSKKKNQTIKMI